MASRISDFLSNLLRDEQTLDMDITPQSDYSELDDTLSMEQDLGLQERPDEIRSTQETGSGNRLLDLLKKSEGTSNFDGTTHRPYDSLEGGAPTIGYGTKLQPSSSLSQGDIDQYKSDGMSEPQAETQLRRGIGEAETKLTKLTGRQPSEFLNKEQEDAVLSYTYNVGNSPNWKFSQHLKAASNADIIGDEAKKQYFINQAISEMDIDTAGGKTLSGLTKRREDERDLGFSTPGGMSLPIEDEVQSTRQPSEIPQQLNVEAESYIPGGMSEESPPTEYQSIGQPAQVPEPTTNFRAPALTATPEVTPQTAPATDTQSEMIKAILGMEKAKSESKVGIGEQRAKDKRNAFLLQNIGNFLGAANSYDKGQYSKPVNNAKMINEIIDSRYAGKLADQQNDPSSELSKIYQEFGNKMFPDKAELFKGVSAAQFEKVFPVLAKQVQSNKKYTDTEEKIKLKEDATIRGEERKETRDTKKAEAKEQVQLKKENRETRKSAKDSLTALDSQENFIDDALKLLEQEGASTGPIDQYVSKFTPLGQKLQKTINNISLDKMVKMFAGMSKAIDSDAERAFFASTQPNMSDYESVNVDTLKELKKNIQSLRGKTQQAVEQFSETGERLSSDSESSGKPQPGDVVRSGGKRYRVDQDGENLIEL